MKDKQLLFSITKKDFKIEYFKSPGAGGQHKNKTLSAVKITHIESGAVAQATESRSQHQNKKLAFQRLIETETFKKWYKIKTAQMLGIYADIDAQVDRMMDERNLKIEYYNPEEKRWELAIK